MAVDFSAEPLKPRASMRVVLGAGVAASAMVLVTLFSLSKGGVFESSAATTETRSVGAQEPAAALPEPPSAPAPAAPATTPAPEAAAAPSDTPAAAPAASEPAAATSSPAASSPAASSPAAEAAATEAPGAAEPASDAPAASEGKTAAARMRAKLRKRMRSTAASNSSDEASSEAAESDTPARTKRAPLRSKTSRSKKVASAEAARGAESAEAGEDEAPRAPEQPTTGFNRQAAQAALKEAAAQAGNCRPAGGPTGSGRVQVRYDASGKVGAVSILTPGFENTTTGSCIQMVFRRAKIASFSGASVTLNESFEIR